MNIMISACAKYLLSALFAALLVSIAKVAFASSASLTSENSHPTVATSTASANIYVAAEKSVKQ